MLLSFYVTKCKNQTPEEVARFRSQTSGLADTRGYPGRLSFVLLKFYKIAVFTMIRLLRV